MSAFVRYRNHGSVTVSAKEAWRRAGYFALTLLAAVLLWAAFSTSAFKTQNPVLLSDKSARNPAIALRAARIERRAGYLTVTGEATNRLSASLANVEAVVEYFDSEGRLVRMDSALTSLRSIPGKGEAAFEIHSRDSASIVSCRIRFRDISGRDLSDARPN